MTVRVPLSADFFAVLILASFLAVTSPSGRAAEDSHGEHGNAVPPRSSPPSAKRWTNLPLIVPGGLRGERGSVSLIGDNIAAGKLLVFSPAQPGLPRSVDSDGGRWLVTPERPDRGGHHLLAVTEERAGRRLTATTVWSFPANGEAPTRLLQSSRGGLEVLPRELPEHGGIREGETWDFSVRFDGQPLPHATLWLETEAGSRSRGVTDERGIARLTFPRDFDPAAIDPKAGAARTRQGFVAAAEYDQGGTSHLTAFNYSYYPDLMREQSLSYGFGFLVLGMVLATPLLRRLEKTDV